MTKKLKGHGRDSQHKVPIMHRRRGDRTMPLHSTFLQRNTPTVVLQMYVELVTVFQTPECNHPPSHPVLSQLNFQK